MERGEFITCKAPFGYRLVDGKNLEIVPEKAAYVRWMYEEYLNGRSLEWLAERMTGTGIPTTDGCQRWNRFAVTYILTNEKYVGDALCQKTYSSGFPFVKQRNHGERDQYYVEHTHPALISREMFDKVQELLHRKGKRTNKIERPSPLEKPSCKVRLFAQNRFREYLQKVTATTLSQTASDRVFQLLAQTAHVRFRERKRVHTRLRQ